MKQLFILLVFSLSLSITFAQLKVENTSGLASNKNKNVMKIISNNSVNVTPQDVDYWTGTTTATAKTQTSLINGYSDEDGWMKFDITSVPDNAMITGIVFNGYVNTTNYPYWSITPLTIDPVTSDAATLSAAIIANQGETIAYNYNNEGSTYAVGWKQHTLGGTAVQDFQAALVNDWFAVGIASRDNSTTYYINFDGWNETNSPYLEVFYDVAVTNDVAVVSVDMPSILGAGTMTPKATVKSLSDINATFNVTMTITGGTAYTSTKSVTDLTSFATEQVLFDEWIPDMGVNYTVNVCTELAGDPNTANNCMDLDVSVVDAELSYLYIAYDPTSTLPEGPGSFNLPDASAMTSLANTTSAQFITGGTWRKDLPAGDSYWFGVEYYDASASSGGNLYTFNTSTGVMTIVGSTGLALSINGIAYDRVSNTLYGVSGTSLYTISMTTGTATLIGSIGIASSTFINLACSPDGDLFSVNIADDNLYSINKTTGAGTLIGSIGFDASYAQDMEFNLEDGLLYMAAYNVDNNGGTGELRLVNPTDGSTTLINEFQFGAEICGFAIPYGSIVPVELTSFSASITGGKVSINWQTSTETNNYGFEVERKIPGQEFAKIGFVAGFGTTTENRSYSFADNSITSGTYVYRLKQIDFNGSFEYSPEVEVTFETPVEFSLSQNFPNPFNPSTKINFTLTVDSKVSLKVFNILGEEVTTLINQSMSAGLQEINFDASHLNSGVYFYRIDAQGINGEIFSETMKMMLTK